MTRKVSKDVRRESQRDSALITDSVRKATHRPAYTGYSLAFFFLMLITGISFGGLLIFRNAQLRTILSDIFSPLVNLSVGVILFFTGRNTSKYSKRFARAWWTFAMALVLYAMGDIAWFILEIGLNSQPFPSIADIFYLAYYPIALVGVFLLLDTPGRGEWIKRSIDIGIVMVAAILGLWNFFIGPIIASHAGETRLAEGILLAYPVGDFVLLVAMLLLLYDLPEKRVKTPIFWLGYGLLFTIIADCIYSYQSLTGTYVSGSILDLGWIVSSVFFGLAGLSQWKVSLSKTTEEETTPAYAVQKKNDPSITIFPYLWLIAAFILLINGGMGWIPLRLGFLPLSLGVGAIICLIIVRQLISLAENNRLNIELHNYVERVQSQSVALELANLDLQNDIAERKLVEEALRGSEAHLSEALRVARMGYWGYDVNLDQFTFNDQFYTIFRTTAEHEGGYVMSSARFVVRFVHPQDGEIVKREFQKAHETTDPDYETEFDHRIIRLDGETGYLSVHIRIAKDDQGRTVKSHGVCQDITDRMQIEAARQQSEALFRTLFELSPDAILLIDPFEPAGTWPIIDCNVAACMMNGYTREELIGQCIDIVNANALPGLEKDDYLKSIREEGILRYSTTHRRKDGSIFPLDVSTTLITVGGRELLVGIDHDITKRVKSEEENKKRLAELEAVNQLSTALRLAQTREDMLPLLLDTTLEVFHATQGAVWLHDPVKNELRPAVIRGWATDPEGPPILPERPGEGINGYAFATGQPFITSDFHQETRLSDIVRQRIPIGMGGASIPIHAGQGVIGTIDINVSLPRELSLDEIHLLTTLSEIAGNAIQRTTLHQQTERRLQQLTALSNIDRAISSTSDIHLSLGLLLEHVIIQLRVDATDVLLFNSALQTLEFSTGRGFKTKAFEHARLRLGEGYAGRAVLSREIMYVPNLTAVHDNPRLEKHLEDEQFVSYYGIPLVARGQVRGVLEIFQRSPLEPDKEWLDFLSSLAGQAAIAIDSATQFDNLQRTNNELLQAYDETIEGWSRALDMRDYETEGHTQRVTEMTVSLAREAGLSEADLVHVRWGSLLHDIGKMGVPDSILLKTGPLSDEEWDVMKQHPVFAYEMISPIRYLRGALDIPYCHHEKWDGTGYPRGLKGEQIPLAARIFAVVDVWDALCSDRPYCSAWPEERVREHIRAGSGTHFDPKFVETFLRSDTFRSNLSLKTDKK